jgi:hypothetical protein
VGCCKCGKEIRFEVLMVVTYCLLGCNVMQLGESMAFQRNILLSSSWPKNKPSKEPEEVTGKLSKLCIENPA